MGKKKIVDWTFQPNLIMPEKSNRMYSAQIYKWNVLTFNEGHIFKIAGSVLSRQGSSNSVLTV